MKKKEVLNSESPIKLQFFLEVFSLITYSRDGVRTNLCFHSFEN